MTKNTIKPSDVNQLKEILHGVEAPHKVDHKELDEALQDEMQRGLTVEYDDTSFTMKINGREDSGTLSQPVSAIKAAAQRLVGPVDPAQV